MIFNPAEENEYEAVRGLLVHRFEQWAWKNGIDADPFVVETALDYRHLGTPDGRLGLWDQRNIEEFLLDWVPRTVTVLPDEEPADAPGTLRCLLRYLDAVHLADPRGASLPEVLEAVDAAAPRYAAAMADRSLWGLAKFWITTAAEHGVDVHDEQALQDFVGRAQGGEVPYDPEVLQTIVERHVRSSGPVRSEPQLPVALPGDDVLREQAGRSPVLRQLRELAEWAGRDRRTLTGSGRLRLSDAKELVERLDTGDDTDSVRSSADLPRLNLLVEWAKKARLIRVAKGRLCAVAKAEPVLNDPLALWRRAFDAFRELPSPVRGGHGGRYGGSVLFDANDVYDVVLPDVLATLYSLLYPMPWPGLRDSVHLAYRSSFLLEVFATGSIGFEQADDDLRAVLGVLEELGAIECHQGMADPVFADLAMRENDLEGWAGVPTEDDDDFETPSGLLPGMPTGLAGLLDDALSGDALLDGAPPDDALLSDAQLDNEATQRARKLKSELSSGPVELIRLTDLGTDSVRRRLLAEGRDAPLIGELAPASPAGLLGVLADHYDPESARVELAAWIAVHGDRSAALEQLVCAVRTMPFRTRAEAMLDVLVSTLDDGELLLRSLRSDPSLAPTALSLLARREILTPEDLTEPESLLMVAESLLQLCEATGADGVSEVLRQQGREAEEALRAALASGHPDREGLAALQALAERVPPERKAHLGLVQQRGHRKNGRRGGKRRR
ncbi:MULTISPECIES: hypothetical protein [unclassified Streptomyces]|uniref:hypothetical protein n=1 Tax=unclassified Streptomyces TaxID=2593676 RepID=UPI002E806EC3|nr:hypothetical protein [Streptomyces sp. NBC_00589]WTI33709.1 hypothetical protein OIC96_01205 [Streptomyces sp. NBC_00775]WUB32619.1 hypothetical protein OHA51_48530 [Streptomyces sp. NBC_00589]